MEIPFAIVVQGVIVGLTYGLLALGLVLIYKSNRVLNFAHGQLGVVSAVVLHKLIADHSFPYWPTLVLVLVLAALTGAACELLLRRLFNRPRLLVMVATIGLAQLLFVVSIIGVLQPKHAANTFPVPFHIHGHIGSYVLQPSDVTVLVFAPLVAIALALFFRMSPYGLAMRASAENAESARLGGIRVRMTSTIAWMIAGVLSAVTAILVTPYKPPSGYAEALGPSLLVRALAAALLGGMIDLRVAFVAGIGVGVIEQVVGWNDPHAVEAVIYGLLLVVLVVRVRRLRVTSRTEERSSWQFGGTAHVTRPSPERSLVGGLGTAITVLVALLLPTALSNSQAFLFSRIFVFAVIAISITMLSGWAGQLSLGHFGLVAIGAVVTARWGTHVSFPLLLLAAGSVGAIASVVVGVPALRIRGLYLAVTTLGFAVFVSGWVLTDGRFGLPDPSSTFLTRPRIAGLDMAPQRTWYYVALAVLVLVALGAQRLRESGVGRAMIAVRDNETGAGAMGIRVVVTKVTAFAVSGFVAGVGGVLFAYGQQRIGVAAFDPYQSIVIVAMVVIGGMGSIRGAICGAVYLLGLPALFGTTASSSAQQTVQFLTGGIGLLVFVLYLPGGIAAQLDRIGDLAAASLGRQRVAVPAPEVAS